MIYNNISSYIKENGNDVFFQLVDDYIKWKYLNVVSNITDWKYSFFIKKSLIIRIINYIGYLIVFILLRNMDKMIYHDIQYYISFFFSFVISIFLYKSYSKYSWIRQLRVLENNELSHKNNILNEINILLWTNLNKK